MLLSSVIQKMGMPGSTGSSAPATMSATSAARPETRSITSRIASLFVLGMHGRERAHQQHGDDDHEDDDLLEARRPERGEGFDDADQHGGAGGERIAHQAAD